MGITSAGQGGRYTHGADVGRRFHVQVVEVQHVARDAPLPGLGQGGCRPEDRVGSGGHRNGNRVDQGRARQGKVVSRRVEGGRPGSKIKASEVMVLQTRPVSTRPRGAMRRKLGASS